MKHVLIGLLLFAFIVPVLAQDGAEEKDASTNEASVIQLENYAGELDDAINELEDLELIGKEGFPLFENLTPTIIGEGEWILWLDPSVGPYGPDFGDVVMAGMINFQSESNRETETCELIMRADYLASGNILRVGFDNEGFLFYDDWASDYVTTETSVDLSKPQHILAIVADDRLTVFINGEMMLENVEIDERRGVQGLGLNGEVSATRCDAENVWVYAAPPAETDTCYTSVSRPARLREGPGTNFTQVGTQARGDFYEIIGNVLGEDGFIWLELENEGWVRIDLVQIIGTCETLPDSGSQSV